MTYFSTIVTTITVDKIIEIHEYIIQETGGTNGLLNLGTIEFLIYELSKKSNEFEKSSIILHLIITGHPFFDGNKRTAFQIADNFLRENGIYIHEDKNKIEDFLLKIAKDEYSIEEIAKWVQKKSRRLKISRQLQLSQTSH